MASEDVKEHTDVTSGTFPLKYCINHIKRAVVCYCYNQEHESRIISKPNLFNIYTLEEDTTVTVDVTSPVVMDTDGQGNVQKTDSTIVVSPGSSSPSSEVSGHHAVDVSMVTDTQRVPSPNDNQRIHTEEMEKATDNVHKICISQVYKHLVMALCKFVL